MEHMIEAEPVTAATICAVATFKRADAIAERRTLIAKRIAKAIPGRARTRVASLACGSCREIFDVLARSRSVEFTAIDNDPEALACVRAKAERLGVAKPITLVRDSVVRLACGRGRSQLGPQELIYSVDLVDYLDDEYVIVLLNWAYEHLTPGGTALFGNFDDASPDRDFMDSLAESRLICRSPDDLGRLFARSRFGGEAVEVFSDRSNVNLFAAARKR